MKGTQPVMGLGKGTCSKQIQADSVIYWNIPKTWNLAEAATIPCVYSTVYYALDYKCRMNRGESILIHAGAGGIGQAAIHLCIQRGLNVFTTCFLSHLKSQKISGIPTLHQSLSRPS